MRNEIGTNIALLGPRDIDKVSKAIEKAPVPSTIVAGSMLETALSLSEYTPGLQHVVHSETKDRLEPLPYLIKISSGSRSSNDGTRMESREGAFAREVCRNYLFEPSLKKGGFF